MLTDKRVEKLKDIALRAISINEVLLGEEKKFVTAVSEHQDVPELKRMSEKIICLLRKEKIYCEVAQSLIEKLLKE